LGPLTVWRGADGDRQEIVDPDLRRSRVRELLAYLVGHRRTHRAAITAALWPDLDDQSAGNNLGVTLNYLLRALEPWRTPGEPPYLIRLEGQRVELMTGPHLHVDVDEFAEHLVAAARAEAEGSPSTALEHGLAAIRLYRDDLLVDLADAEWLDADRSHYRTRFLTVSARAAQLLVGRGDTMQAEAMAERALRVDPWNEDAYSVLASAALARGDRSAARAALERCLAALADLGAGPSDATLQLGRRCGLVPVPTPV
jgi:LuxR family maltose regulon positive regulatory protein